MSKITRYDDSLYFFTESATHKKHAKTNKAVLNFSGSLPAWNISKAPSYLISPISRNTCN